MQTAQLQLIAGSISSLLFITGAIPKLLKVYRTHDLRSYSFSNIALDNVGNLVHWLYVSSLPFGPIWLMHGFFTVASVLLLFGYLLYERKPCLTLR